MALTIAESIHEEGKREGKREGIREGKREGKREGIREGSLAAKRETLIKLLRIKFSRQVTAKIVKLVEAADDLSQLDAWLEKLVRAETLDEVGLTGKK